MCVQLVFLFDSEYISGKFQASLYLKVSGFLLERHFLDDLLREKKSNLIFSVDGKGVKFVANFHNNFASFFLQTVLVLMPMMLLLLL